MFSRILPWPVMFHWLPNPDRLTFLGDGASLIYQRVYDFFKRAASEYHRSLLSEIDPDYYTVAEANYKHVQKEKEKIEQATKTPDPEREDLEEVAGV